MNARPSKSLPDVVEHSLASASLGALTFVGMHAIDLPLRMVVHGAPTETMLVPAKADVGVDVDAAHRGIHMSRLYRLLQNLTDAPWSLGEMLNTTRAMIASHADRSACASLRLSFDYVAKRGALLSDNHGWKAYPVGIHVAQEKRGATVHTTVCIEVTVAYSSTCPCSAALSRQLIQEQFANDFIQDDTVAKTTVQDWLGRTESICATPHSQRSTVTVKATLADAWIKDAAALTTEGAATHYFARLIEGIEKTLITVVQTAVKREDEQEFARLNAANLMFCEDAARRVRNYLGEAMTLGHIRAYQGEVVHYESLHPHNAVARFSDNADNGEA